MASKVVQNQVVNVNPKPKEVIKICPDAVEGVVEIAKYGKKNAAPTLTSVLTARSKAAFGLTNKPKEVIVDIDAKVARKYLAAGEYIKDMHTYYKLVENVNIPRDFMDSQHEINKNVIAMLMDLLVGACSKFQLSVETCYHTTNIIGQVGVDFVPDLGH